jgi:hypothetical protein
MLHCSGRQQVSPHPISSLIGQEMPSAGRKEYPLVSCKPYLHWMLLVSSVMQQRRSMKIKQTSQIFSLRYHCSTYLSQATLTDIDKVMFSQTKEINLEGKEIYDKTFIENVTEIITTGLVRRT